MNDAPQKGVPPATEVVPTPAQAEQEPERSAEPSTQPDVPAAVPAISATSSEPAGRLTGVEITNYRGYLGTFRLALPNGENVIVYGENGAGKSSLYHALKGFLEASDVDLKIADYSHRFSGGKPSVRLEFGEQSFEWTEVKTENRDRFVRLLNQGKGFLDYRALLEIHYVRSSDQTEIELFPLLINRLLPYYSFLSRGNSLSFQSGWQKLTSDVKKRWRSTQDEADFLEDLSAFNDALDRTVRDLADRASAMLAVFDGGFVVGFQVEKAALKKDPKRIDGPRILVRPALRQLKIIDYNVFLNEARLTALAICLFFAALKESPATGLRILALDDILIGLDMSNRVKVLDLINTYFADWQIVILTYSKAWFERLKVGVAGLKWVAPWSFVVLYEEWHDGETSPRIVAEGSGDLIEMARRHLRMKDYSAGAVYARKALEALCHSACAKAKLSVLHVEKPKDRKLQHLLDALKLRLEELTDDARRTKALEIFGRLNQAREFVLNRNAHFEVEDEDTLSAEVGAAIEVVKDMSDFLKSQEWAKPNFRSGRKLASREQFISQISAARQLAAQGAIPECLDALKIAHHFFWLTFGEEQGVLVPIGAEISTPMIWKAANEQAKLSAEASRRLDAAKGYLFGSVKLDKFDTARFEEVAKLLVELAPPLPQAPRN
jgi:energy-coupling factor transporter ATP-binding protein EcfA2